MLSSDALVGRIVLHGAADGISDDIVHTQVEIILTQAERRDQIGGDPA